jgi:hypothetical protein
LRVHHDAVGQLDQRTMARFAHCSGLCLGGWETGWSWHDDLIGDLCALRIFASAGDKRCVVSRSWREPAAAGTAVVAMSAAVTPMPAARVKRRMGEAETPKF